ncbi:MAG: rubredoxin [Nitrososphaerota archaeon]|jgi:rubredoxin|nr:rubredoxin [Nitrososphaerota archaeon]
MRKFKCSICGYVYDEAAGIPEKGIAPETKWENLSDKFICPTCTAPKMAFQLLNEAPDQTTVLSTDNSNKFIETIAELSAGEISAICSSLAKGCEKQRLTEEMDSFKKLADYFKIKTTPIQQNTTLHDIIKMLEKDLNQSFSVANKAAKANADRGAQRSLMWSEKVSTMTKSLLERFTKEGDLMLKNTNVYVCDICGLITIGDTPPDVCPVCKVPNFKITKIERD